MMLERWDVVERRTFLKLLGMSAAAVALAPHVMADTISTAWEEKTLSQFGCAYRLSEINDEVIKRNILPIVSRDIAYELYKKKHLPVFFEKSGGARVYIKKVGSSGTVDPTDIHGAVGVKVFAVEDRREWADMISKKLKEIETPLIARGTLLSLAASSAKKEVAKEIEKMILSVYPFSRDIPYRPQWAIKVPENYGTTIKIPRFAKAR